MTFNPSTFTGLAGRRSFPGTSCAWGTGTPPTRRFLAAALVVVLPGLASCEAWDDGPPPATAHASANGPAEPLPPGPPIAAPPSGAPADAPFAQSQGGAGSDETHYTSGEYAIGEDTDRYPDSDPAALSDFRAPLAPYGEWTDDPTYGSVWVPSSAAVGADFTPYVSSGHWAYDDDYVWVSDYSWGWAPFHYGRWVLVDGRGWAWIPGREYRGAWVTWSVDDGYSYLGWAPMGPAFVWFGGMPVAWHGGWGPRWAYVPRGEVFSPRVGARVVVGPSAVALSARMRVYSVGEGRVAGPPPARFGYAAAQVPRVTGAAAVSVRHAQEFSRPSTARALGATAATVPSARVESQSRSAATVESRGPLGPRDGRATPTTMTARPAPGGVTNAPRTVAPATNSPRSVAPAAVAPMRAPPPEFHSGPTFHSGGHRR